MKYSMQFNFMIGSSATLYYSTPHFLLVLRFGIVRTIELYLLHDNFTINSTTDIFIVGQLGTMNP